MMVLSYHVHSYYIDIVVETVKFSLRVCKIEFEKNFTAILIKPSPLPQKKH